MSYKPRRAEPRIVDPETHPRSSVCLTVAAAFLGISDRTLRSRIDDGQLRAYRDGKVYRITIRDLIAYRDKRAA